MSNRNKSVTESGILLSHISDQNIIASDTIQTFQLTARLCHERATRQGKWGRGTEADTLASPRATKQESKKPNKQATMATCVCVFQAEGNSGVSGALKLSQSSEDAATTVEGQIRGLTPGQKHGIAVCVFGDMTDGGTSCGPSFNPFGE
jgi:hypothetical protein